MENMYRHLNIWHAWNKTECGPIGYFMILDYEALEVYPMGNGDV